MAGKGVNGRSVNGGQRCSVNGRGVNGGQRCGVNGRGVNGGQRCEWRAKVWRRKRATVRLTGARRRARGSSSILAVAVVVV